CNTLLVSVLAIVTTTVIGLVLGIMRLSPNWLARNTAFAVVEFVKNTPQLVQIFFIYVGVLQALPQTRESLSLGGAVFLNIRGLFLPAPILAETAGTALLLLLAGLAAGVVLWRVRLRRTGSTRGVLGLLAWILPLAAIAYAVDGGIVAGWDRPELKGFNFRGGFAVRPELLALWLGLANYTGAFVAE